MLPSRVLAYIQIGTFVIVVTSSSWIISTFFFTSLLKVLQPGKEWTEYAIEKTCIMVRQYSRNLPNDNSSDDDLDDVNPALKPVFAVSEKSIDDAVSSYQRGNCSPQLTLINSNERFNRKIFFGFVNILDVNFSLDFRGTLTSIVTVVVDEGIIRVKAPEPSPPLPPPPPLNQLQAYEMSTSFSMGGDSEDDSQVK